MTHGICIPFYPTVSVARKLMFQNGLILYITRKEMFCWRNCKKRSIPKNASILRYWVKCGPFIPLQFQKPKNYYLENLSCRISIGRTFDAVNCWENISAWKCLVFEIWIRCDPSTIPVVQKWMFENPMVLHIIRKEILYWLNFKKPINSYS